MSADYYYNISSQYVNTVPLNPYTRRDLDAQGVQEPQVATHLPNSKLIDRALIGQIIEQVGPIVQVGGSIYQAARAIQDTHYVHPNWLRTNKPFLADQDHCKHDMFHQANCGCSQGHHLVLVHSLYYLDLADLFTMFDIHGTGQREGVEDLLIFAIYNAAEEPFGLFNGELYYESNEETTQVVAKNARNQVYIYNNVSWVQPYMTNVYRQGFIRADVRLKLGDTSLVMFSRHFYQQLPLPARTFTGYLPALRDDTYFGNVVTAEQLESKSYAGLHKAVGFSVARIFSFYRWYLMVGTDQQRIYIPKSLIDTLSLMMVGRLRNAETYQALLSSGRRLVTKYQCRESPNKVLMVAAQLAFSGDLLDEEKVLASDLANNYRNYDRYNQTLETFRVDTPFTWFLYIIKRIGLVLMLFKLFRVFKLYNVPIWRIIKVLFI